MFPLLPLSVLVPQEEEARSSEDDSGERNPKNPTKHLLHPRVDDSFEWVINVRPCAIG
jgi:hypothetical protein